MNNPGTNIVAPGGPNMWYEFQLDRLNLLLVMASLGSRTTLDVLNAEQELLDARANTISAQADEVIASYSVLLAMGLMTADHLGLPVQQYDPTEYYNLVKDSPAALSEQGKALDRVLEAIGQ
ncbi:MAG: TolC family protein [Acidobacteriota bacterium]